MKLIVYKTVDRFGDEYICNAIASSLLQFINYENKAYAKFWSGKRTSGAHDSTGNIKILNVVDITEEEAKPLLDTSYSDKAGMEYENNAFNTDIRDIRTNQ